MLVMTYAQSDLASLMYGSVLNMVSNAFSVSYAAPKEDQYE